MLMKVKTGPKEKRIERKVGQAKGQCVLCNRRYRNRLQAITDVCNDEDGDKYHEIC